MLSKDMGRCIYPLAFIVMENNRVGMASLRMAFVGMASLAGSKCRRTLATYRTPEKHLKDSIIILSDVRTHKLPL